jgi:hypothetical protein
MRSAYLLLLPYDEDSRALLSINGPRFGGLATVGAYLLSGLDESGLT